MFETECKVSTLAQAPTDERRLTTVIYDRTARYIPTDVLLVKFGHKSCVLDKQ